MTSSTGSTASPCAGKWNIIAMGKNYSMEVADDHSFIAFSHAVQ
jgi:hypothetical protein